MPSDAGKETDNEIEYRYVRGQGWVAGYRPRPARPGDYIIDWKIRTLTYTMPTTIHYVTITGTVEI